MAGRGFLNTLTLDELEEDPYPAYARLRRDAPIAWAPAADVWFVTRFADCASVGGGDLGFVGASNHPTLQRAFGKPNVLTSDGEEHADLRSGVDPKLQPRSVNEMVDELVRPLARAALAELRGRTSAELMSAFFEPVSVEALRHVMGLDGLVDATTLRRWFHDLNGGVANFGLDPDLFAVAERATAEIEDIVRPRLAQLVATPDDSMLSHMLWAGREGRGPRSMELILPSLKVILLGGMQEPGHSAGSTLLGLLSQPDQLRRLYEAPDEYVPLAVHEGMRWIAPIGAVERQASRDVVMHGQVIPAGSIVQVVLGSANRDEARFDEPDRFDMDRVNRTHQAFGNGEHFCAGHFFARQVQHIMFEELLAALPGLRPSAEDTPKVSGWVFRAPKHLPVEWNEPLARESIAVHGRSARAGTRELVVRSMRLVAADVMELVLADPGHAEIGAWTPGAHIDLWLDEDYASQYSLCGDPEERGTWTIAVLREPGSVGVGRFVHETLRPGQIVVVSGPRNHFGVAPTGDSVFIAGGIGVTPILPMVRAVASSGRALVVAYAGSSKAGMAYVPELLAAAPQTQIAVTEFGERLSISEILSAAIPGAHVYCCGPGRMVEEVEALVSEFGLELHVEHFQGAVAHREDDFQFDVTLASSGKTISIPPDQSVLDVLEVEGVRVLNACRAGNCGSCETRVLAGRVDHRDLILTPKQRQRNDRMMVCVSRAANGGSLILDL